MLKLVMFSGVKVQISRPIPFDANPRTFRTVPGTPLTNVMRVNQSSSPNSSLAQTLYAKRWMTNTAEIMPKEMEMAAYSRDLSRMGASQMVAVRFVVTVRRQSQGTWLLSKIDAYRWRP